MNHTTQAELRRVTLDRIRGELRSLWRSEGADSDAVIRALSHNLIVYTSGDETMVQKTMDRIAGISSARPGRVIVIQSDPSPKDMVDAWVTLYCQMQGHRQVCAEMVMLLVSGRMRDEIHSSVLSLLAPDIPVYLWWMECPGDSDHLYSKLAEEADKVLVDSDTFESSDDLVKLAGQTQQAIGDLAWAKLTAWRRQTAQLWEVPDLQDALTNLRTVDIVYVAPGDYSKANRALLLLGWLADRFEWELVRAKIGPTGGYMSQWRKWRWEGKAEIVESAYESLPVGDIVSIYLQAGKHPPFVMPRLEYIAERQCIETRLNDASPSARRHSARYSPMSTAEALVEEIDQRYDPYYRLALQRAVQIVRSAQSSR